MDHIIIVSVIVLFVMMAVSGYLAANQLMLRQRAMNYFLVIELILVIMGLRQEVSRMEDSGHKMRITVVLVVIFILVVPYSTYMCLQPDKIQVIDGYRMVGRETEESDKEHLIYDYHDYKSKYLMSSWVHLHTEQPRPVWLESTRGTMELIWYSADGAVEKRETKTF